MESRHVEGFDEPDTPSKVKTSVPSVPVKASITNCSDPFDEIGQMNNTVTIS
jgi:hypothetical protein